MSTLAERYQTWFERKYGKTYSQIAKESEQAESSKCGVWRTGIPWTSVHKDISTTVGYHKCGRCGEELSFWGMPGV